MSEGIAATAYTEVPVFFDAPEGRVFGIVTLPSTGLARTGLIILPGAGTPLSVNRNRLSVRICRAIAPLGYAVLRCDYHGTGESTGVAREFALERPFKDDVVAAAGRLREMGVERVILAGSCYGGRTALAAAVEIEDVEAVVLLATTPRDYRRGERKSTKAAASWGLGRYAVEALRPRRLRGLFSKRARRSYGKYARAKMRAMTSTEPAPGSELVSPRYERYFRELVDRRVLIVQVFGTDDSSYEEYLAAAAGPLADALSGKPHAVDVRTIPGKVHGFLNPPIQDAVVQDMLAWAAERRSGDRVEARTGADEGA